LPTDPVCQFARKKPVVAVTPGLGKLRSAKGRLSTAQRLRTAKLRGQFIRRLAGDATRALLFRYRIGPQFQHDLYPWLNCGSTGAVGTKC
jgi:hypothetical protein